MRISRWCLRFALLALLYSPIHSNLAAQSEADVNASIKKFTSVYETVETNFARQGRSGPLRLPRGHSGHASNARSAFEFLRSQGVCAAAGRPGRPLLRCGMWVGAPLGKVIVMWPFEGSPAFRAGLRPGDELIAVNDTNTEHSTVSQVSTMLKGPRGTPVTVTARRVGSPGTAALCSEPR